MALKIPTAVNDLIFLAKIAEQAERYEEMVVFMKRVVKAKAGLSPEERNLLSVAYKNVIGSRRSSWRIVNSIEQKEIQRGASHVATISAYRKRIESEVGEICEDITSLLEKNLVPNAIDTETKVFLLKMKGDYHRYYAESSPANCEAQKKLALDAYNQAMAIATPGLLPTHPIRLGLALNFSVFYYEILKNTEKGCEMARQAFDDACPDLESLDEENYKESTLIMHLLRDNLTLWKEDAADAEQRDDGTKMEDM
jgi:14-3-3 protein epsilon